MKKYLTAAFLIGTLAAAAQQKQGTVIYTRRIDLYRHMSDDRMKAMAPHYQTDQHVLAFRDSISVYRAAETDERPDPFASPGGNVMIRVGGPGDEGMAYRNFARGQILEERALGDKDYIIEDSLRLQPWKLSDETKMIGQHPCKKATLKTERGDEVVAWYAEDIPVPAGPGDFGGLPGLILMLDLNEGEMIFTATDIQKKVNEKELRAPKKGKWISRADFKKKMDEAFGPADADGRRIIRREN